MLEMMASCSRMACVSCPWNVLNFCSCMSTICALVGTGMPRRMIARASRISCRISRSKLMYSLPSFRTSRVAANPLFMLAIDCCHAVSHTVSYSTSARAILL
eukprot:gene19142-biopygen19408